MLMAWGPFRFTVATHSVEALQRTLQPRVEAQPVIGAVPPLHRLGPSNGQVVLESTFFPQHLNIGGMNQIAAIREAVNNLVPLPLVHAEGSIPNIFGMWVATNMQESHTTFDRFGWPQKVVASLTMMQDGGGSSAGRRAAMLSFSLGGFNIGVGF